MIEKSKLLESIKRIDTEFDVMHEHNEKTNDYFINGWKLAIHKVRILISELEEPERDFKEILIEYYKERQDELKKNQERLDEAMSKGLQLQPQGFVHWYAKSVVMAQTHAVTLIYNTKCRFGNIEEDSKRHN